MGTDTVRVMSRYRLYPTREQESALLAHCKHARYMWNLAVEQLRYWRRGQRMPGFAEQCRQLTEARAEHGWLADGSQTVQQQALRDFNQATTSWYNGTHRAPTWRKRGRHEGFRIVGPQVKRVEQLSGKWSRVLVPKVGWVKLRRTRPISEAKSYRVTRDSAGRWHIAFAVVPEPIVGPRDGTVVGIDRGVAVTLVLSGGAIYQAPQPLPIQQAARALARCQRGSNRRKQAKQHLARLHVRNANRRKDWVEKASTEIARRYDLIRIEDLKVATMTRSARGTPTEPGCNVRQKAGLNRAILNGGWSLFAARLEHKAAGRVEKIDPAYSSQRCSACGHIARESRKSQALFRCVACRHTSNADLNAAKNIAAGRAVRGAGRPPVSNREPQRSPSSDAAVGIPALQGREDVNGPFWSTTDGSPQPPGCARPPGDRRWSRGSRR